MAGEKAAAYLQLERQEALSRAESERVRRREASQRASSTAVSADYDVVPMESLGSTYQKLANHQRVGHAVKAGARHASHPYSCPSMSLRQLRREIQPPSHEVSPPLAQVAHVNSLQWS